MAIITETPTLGAGYELDPIREFAEQFNNIAKSICTEGQLDYYQDTQTALNSPSARNTLKNYFLKESYDSNELTKPSQIEYHNKEMTQLFENDMKAMNEACAINSFNPLVGMALPMHKNIMMNMVWDKGGIPKKAAPNEKFTRTMETRLLVTPEGDEIDMWLEQNKMTKAMRHTNPWKTHRFTTTGDPGSTFATSTKFNPITDATDGLGGKPGVDHIDVESYISAVCIPNVVFEVGDILPDDNGFIPEVGGTKATAQETHDLWIKTRLKFAPGYGEIKRQLMRPVGGQFKQSVTIPPATTGGTATTSVETVQLMDVVTANITKDIFSVATMHGVISGVEVSYKLDASARTIEVCTVKWTEKTDIVEIGTDEGINCTVSPEEVKDTSMLYNINQTTKVMSLMKTALANRKNDEIKEGMDESYHRLPQSQRFAGVFDYAPRQGYLLDHLEWRKKTFWDYFDTQITQMFRVLNDPNMTVSVFGEPDIIRKLSPTEVSYASPANIGPVDLDFSKTVVTSDKRVYSFVGADNLRTDQEPELIITLNPRNSMRIVYVIYDYQFYISNEIRQNNNPALPNIMAFERYLFDEYQPVQGRVKIANPSGLRPEDNGTIPFSIYTGFAS